MQNQFSGKLPNPFTAPEPVEEEVILDKYGRERQMLVEHRHANRAQRRAQRGRSYTPRSRNVSYRIKEG